MEEGDKQLSILIYPRKQDNNVKPSFRFNGYLVNQFNNLKQLNNLKLNMFDKKTLLYDLK